MSKKKDFQAEYAEELKEYGEKLNFSSNFSTSATLSYKEHKMLVEGYKRDRFHLSKEYMELEVADLSDFLSLERSDGGTIR